MIRYFCDMCKQEMPKAVIFGVRSISGGTCFLTTPGSENDFLGAVQDCEKHICIDCLRKLGWEPEPEDTKA